MKVEICWEDKGSRDLRLQGAGSGSFCFKDGSPRMSMDAQPKGGDGMTKALTGGTGANGIVPWEPPHVRRRRRVGAVVRPEQPTAGDEREQDPLLDRERVVAMLRNLLLFLELGSGGGHVHKDCTSHERESLLCLFASLQKAIPLLPGPEREVISLVGMQGFSECEAAEALGISQQAVSKRLRAAAARIQKSWM